MNASNGTIIVNLDAGEDELWSRLTGKRRTSVRKAEKLGVTAREGGEVEACYQIYRDHCRAKLLYPLARESVFEGTDLHTAELDGEIVAYLAVRRHPSGTPSVPSRHAAISNGSVRPQHRKTQATVLLVWHAIKYYAREGYAQLDLGGVDLHSKETAGIDSFKQGWGGELVEYENEVGLRKYLWWKYCRKSLVMRRIWYWKGLVSLKMRSAI